MLPRGYTELLELLDTANIYIFFHIVQLFSHFVQVFLIQDKVTMLYERKFYFVPH